LRRNLFLKVTTYFSGMIIHANKYAIIPTPHKKMLIAQINLTIVGSTSR